MLGQITSLIGTPGFGAVAVGAFSFIAKCYMSFTVRVKIANMGHAEAKKYFETPERVFVWKSQMNEAEYAPLLLAILWALHTAKVEGALCTAVSIAAPLSQAVYFWGRVLHGQVMPFTPLGGMPRYFSLAAGLYLLYCTL